MASLNPYNGVLGRKKAAHLLRRATFNPSKTNVDDFSAKTAEQAVSDLLNLDPLTLPEPYDPETQDHWINLGAVPPITSDFYLGYYVLGWWCDEARKDNSIGHKLEMFLHTVMPCDRNDNNVFVFDHWALLRFYAQTGDVKTLSRKMILDNRMLLYLDNTLNSAGAVNENYSREYLELHTIQKGPEDGPGSYTNYTELDVQVAARLLTGWRKNWDRNNLDADTGIYRGYANVNAHDQDDKTFSDKFDNLTIVGRNTAAGMEEELDEFVDMIFSKQACALNMIRRLYRFFVSPDITQEIEDDIIGPLAEGLKYTDSADPDHYNLLTALSTLLKSEHFYDVVGGVEGGDNVYGALLKSPLDLFLQTMNLFEIEPPLPVDQETMQTHYRDFYYLHLISSFEVAGMQFFEPETVAGYPSYHQAPQYSRNWFGSATIIGRFKFPEMFLKGKYVSGGGSVVGDTGVYFDIAAFFRDSNFVTDPSDANLLVQEFIENTLVFDADQSRLDYFTDVFLDDLSPINWRIEWNNFLASGDDSDVKIPLENLFTAILYSEEYQLQ